jgi:flavin-dependent dehydrogenase
VRVLVLDRADFPRPKPCGDCLSAGATDVLERLGLLAAIHALPHSRLGGWTIVAPDGRAFSTTFADAAPNGASTHAIAVERTLFDATLLDAAIRAGASFQARVHVRDLLFDDARSVTGVITSGGSVRARIVIGADGLRSVVATRLGAVRRSALLRKLSLTAHVHAPQLASSFGEMHVGDGVVAGIAPVSRAGRCNITVVADADRYGRVVAADAAAFMHTALASLPRLRGRVPTGALFDTQLLASGPFDRPVRRVVFHGAALVGDAAGYYDPFTGQGMHQALCSAEILARVLIGALAQDSAPVSVTTHALRTYAQQRRALVAGARTIQRGIEFFLARPRLANSAIARVARARAFAHALIAVTGDVSRPARLLSPRALLSLCAPDDPLENSA